MSSSSTVALPSASSESDAEQETVQLPSDEESEGELIPDLPDPKPALKRSKAMVPMPFAGSDFQMVHHTVLREDMPPQLVTEVFSPPRVTLHARVAGYIDSKFAFDITYNGWDCMEVSMRRQLKEILMVLKPKVLVLSPPCTMFSPLTWALGAKQQVLYFNTWSSLKTNIL